MPHECTGWMPALRRFWLPPRHSKGREREPGLRFDSIWLSHAPRWPTGGGADDIAGRRWHCPCAASWSSPLSEPGADSANVTDGRPAYYEVPWLSQDDATGESPIPRRSLPLEEFAHTTMLTAVPIMFEWMKNPVAVERIAASRSTSAQSIDRPDFLAWLRDALAQRAAVAQKIISRSPETAAIAGYGAAQEFIREMRRFGCRFALDDLRQRLHVLRPLEELRTDIP